MIEAKGGCHCGAVRFTARLPDPPVTALDCNCSICRMTGLVHIMVAHQDFTLEDGAQSLTRLPLRHGGGRASVLREVRGQKLLPAAISPDSWSVNANCLDQQVELIVDLFDGRNWEQAKALLDGTGPAR